MEAITDGDKYQSVVSALKFHFLSLLFRKMTFDNTSALGLEDIEDVLEESGYRAVRLQEGFYHPLQDLIIQHIPQEVLTQKVHPVLDYCTVRATLETAEQLKFSPTTLLVRIW